MKAALDARETEHEATPEASVNTFVQTVAPVSDRTNEMGWFGNLRKLPEMPHAAHLSQVLAQHEFQEGFKNYRDLRFLTRNLEHWKDNLGLGIMDPTAAQGELLMITGRDIQAFDAIGWNLSPAASAPEPGALALALLGALGLVVTRRVRKAGR